MKTGIKVEIKEFTGNKWEWTGRMGHVTDCSLHCLDVRADDSGEQVRDVLENFRSVESDNG